MELLAKLDAWRHRNSKLMKRKLRQADADRLGRWLGEDCSIISNNCFGGRICQDLDRPYNSPTVGLFFMVEDFMEFCSDLRHYLNDAEMTFIDRSRSENFNIKREGFWGHYPIALLDGKIEVHFLHYKTQDEAVEKWRRRSERVNYDNIVVTCLQLYDIRPEDFEAFETIPFERKVFFTTELHPGCDSEVRISEDRHGGVGDGVRHTRRFYRGWLKKIKKDGKKKA